MFYGDGNISWDIIKVVYEIVFSSRARVIRSEIYLTDFCWNWESWVSRVFNEDGTLDSNFTWVDLMTGVIGVPLMLTISSSLLSSAFSSTVSRRPFLCSFLTVLAGLNDETWYLRSWKSSSLKLDALLYFCSSDALLWRTSSIKLVYLKTRSNMAVLELSFNWLVRLSWIFCYSFLKQFSLRFVFINWVRMMSNFSSISFNETCSFSISFSRNSLSSKLRCAFSALTCASTTLLNFGFSYFIRSANISFVCRMISDLAITEIVSEPYDSPSPRCSVRLPDSDSLSDVLSLRSSVIISESFWDFLLLLMFWYNSLQVSRLWIR